MPPTTLPVIVSAFELVEVDDELDPDALGGKVDCETGIVGVVVMEAVPVTSGESPTDCATEMFQLSPLDVSIYAHLGIRVPFGAGSGKVPGVALEVQLNDHSE